MNKTNPFMCKSMAVLFVIWALALSACTAVAKEPKTEAVEQQALNIIDRASSYLAKQQQFSANVEIWDDYILSESTKIQFSKTVQLDLRRPDHFRAEVTTTQPQKTFLYDGQTVSLIDHNNGFFGITKAPSTIDKTISGMEQAYGLTFPLDDLLLSTPFAGSAAKAQSGQYFGLETIMGRKCHHLAFQHEEIDWQVWVEDGSTPVLRKLIITNKLEEGSPQFTAIFNSWDFTTELPDYHFSFELTPGYLQIDIIESVQEKTSPSVEEQPHKG